MAEVIDAPPEDEASICPSGRMACDSADDDGQFTLTSNVQTECRTDHQKAVCVYGGPDVRPFYPLTLLGFYGLLSLVRSFYNSSLILSTRGTVHIIHDHASSASTHYISSHSPSRVVPSPSS
ncbi:hypothetical protein HPB52_002835 [Rhipicephalus sanguineus]|uniref:Uncharacterized protein n=1 Tax=Rhipicephalus sanguineus TaxID=34632 RepID=A0A9D4PKQ2_RHISA|nr:hypothetical protein HPB52_002835 [Rhipicephalus sanguineus]